MWGYKDLLSSFLSGELMAFWKHMGPTVTLEPHQDHHGSSEWLRFPFFWNLTYYLVYIPFENIYRSHANTSLCTCMSSCPEKGAFFFYSTQRAEEKSDQTMEHSHIHGQITFVSAPTCRRHHLFIKSVLTVPLRRVIYRYTGIIGDNLGLHSQPKATQEAEDAAPSGPHLECSCLALFPGSPVWVHISDLGFIAYHE